MKFICILIFIFWQHVKRPENVLHLIAYSLRLRSMQNISKRKEESEDKKKKEKPIKY